MKKIILTLIVTAASISFGFSQNADLDKRMNKVYTLLEKNKIEKASEQLEEVLDDYSYYGKGWDLLSKIKQKQWNDNKGQRGTYSITVEGGGDEESQKMASDLAAMMNAMVPSYAMYDAYVNTLRMATLKSNTAYSSAILLRNEKVSVNVDTNISEKAMVYYQVAEKAFQQGNYNEAAKNYQKAVEEEPNFYKASLYLGDSYYFIKNYNEAISKFKEAKEKFPYKLEPRKYLLDAYAKEGLYSNSIEEGIASFTVYPDISMYGKLQYVVDLNGGDLDIGWTQRGCFPMVVNNSITDVISNENNAWYQYQLAGNKMLEHCDENGRILESNGLTKTKYLEVYCWEQMLQNSGDDEFVEAKKMQEQGYLDCYVFVTCFHQDLFTQYQDFALNNSDRITEYFNAFIE